MIRVIAVILLTLCTISFIYAQNDSIEVEIDDYYEFDNKELEEIEIVASTKCQATLSSNKLNNKKIGETPVQYLLIDNQQGTYVGFKLIRYKNNIILYTKVFDDNACIRADENFIINFSNTKTLALENKALADCEGDHVLEFSPDQLKMIKNYKIGYIQIYSYDKNYEIRFDDKTYKRFLKNINCLEELEIK